MNYKELKSVQRMFRELDAAISEEFGGEFSLYSIHEIRKTPAKLAITVKCSVLNHAMLSKDIFKAEVTLPMRYINGRRASDHFKTVYEVK